MLRIESVAHAALWFRAANASLLTDPFMFLDGFDARTFCLFPPVRHQVEDFGRLDYVFSSHHHIDHSHPGTLARLRDRVGCALIPAQRAVLEQRYRSLGFENVRLLENGQTTRLAADFSVTAFWSDPVDSVLVVEADGVTSLHANDCVLTDAALAQIAERFRMDYAFLAYTGAQQLYPLLLELPEEELRRRVADKEEWSFGLQANVIEQVRPRVVVPYAYALAYFNGDQLALNGYGRDMPKTFAGRVRKRFPKVATRILSHGDSLDALSGKVSHPAGAPVWSETAEAYVAALSRHATDSPRPGFDPGRCAEVETRLTDFLRRRAEQGATPELARRGALLTVRGGDGERRWAVDFPRRALSSPDSLPTQVIEIEMPASAAAALLDDPDDPLPPLFSYRIRMRKNFSPGMSREEEVSFYTAVVIALFAPHRVGQIF